MERGLTIIPAAAADQVLIEKDSKRGSIKSISINNGHASTLATIDLYLKDSADTPTKTYIVKNFVIPGGVTAVLDHNVSFDNTRLSLLITTVSGGIGAGTPISVIIK